MSATRPGHLLRRLAPPDADDGPLLARFAADRDPTAFAALVRRHGPLVLAVCRRVTGHPQDAEDAFQAVFLVLARKAGALRDPGRLGNWLYGVAAKVASRARRSAARRRVREVQAVDPPDPAAPDAAPPADIGPALHEELAALPPLYREPIVLCDLQGASRSEAAKALGVPEGTLSSRLANGRKKLAERLTRRGVALSALGVPAAVADGRAAVPEALVQHTCGVAAAWAAGAAVPAAVVRLAAGGFPVRSVLLGGVLALSLAAGIVIADGGAAPPAPVPNLLPPPPVAVVADAEEAQPPAKAKEPTAKAVGIGAPRLQEALDLPVRNGKRVVWSPTGDRFVVPFTSEAVGGGGALAAPDGTGEALMVVNFAGPKGPQIFGTTNGHQGERFVGFTPDGKEVLMTHREHGLVSGRHLATFYQFGIVGQPGPGLGGQLGGGGPPGPPGGDGGEGAFTPAGRVLSLIPAGKQFALDNEQTDDFAFAPDGKSYTTLVVTRRDGQTNRLMRVRRVSTETGKTLETLGGVGTEIQDFRLSADGKHAQLIEVGVTKSNVVQGVHLTDGTSRRWAVAADIDQVEKTGTDALVALSPDGARAVVGRGFSKLVLLDPVAQKALPALEGLGLVDANQTRVAFSADGRLLAAAYPQVEKREFFEGKSPARVSVERGESRLGVWDTTTGKLVRSWPGRVTALAFHPSRPVLAVLEPNGAQTRFGLWDFTAE